MRAARASAGLPDGRVRRPTVFTLRRCASAWLVLFLPTSWQAGVRW
ncbi:MAG TPA: hypothetical protein VGR59_13770 [Gemmatimonadaceae bacterium]|nr:hypothetical protein [Gemmatimonadaceae bacterium]